MNELLKSVRVLVVVVAVVVVVVAVVVAVVNGCTSSRSLPNEEPLRIL